MAILKSLLSRGSPLADGSTQLRQIGESTEDLKRHPRFAEKLRETGSLPSFKPLPIEILQMNLGKMCNQTCKHCHVDAGPDRKEVMTRATMEACLRALTATDIEQGVARGKVDMGGRDLDQEVDPDRAVAVALEAFADGLYLVAVDGADQRSLDAQVFLKPDSRVTFVRLAMLAGG